MFKKWIDEYKRVSEKTRFVSQLAAFIISLFSILSLYNLVWWFKIEEFSSLSEFLNVYQMPSAIIFQVAIAIVFAARFSLFFFKSEKSFRFNQIFLVIGFILLGSYWFISRPVDDLPFKIYSMYTSIFRHASWSFDVVGWLFIISSPIKEVCFVLAAFLKSK